MPKSRQRRSTGGGGVQIPGSNPWADSDSDSAQYRQPRSRVGSASHVVGGKHTVTDGDATPKKSKGKVGKGKTQGKSKSQGQGSDHSRQRRTAGPWQFDFDEGVWTQNTTKFQQPGDPATSLTVVTYNVLFDYYEAEKLYSNERHKELCRNLRDEAADIICLQEVTPEFLERLLGLPWIREHYDISDADGHSVRHHGQVILTQFRLRKVHFVNIGNRKRLVVGLVDLLNGTTISLGCVHLKASEGYEKSRIEQLDLCFGEVNDFGRKNGAIAQCIVGDFNFGDGQVENIALRTGEKGSWLDVWPELHWCDTCMRELGPSCVHDVLGTLDARVQGYDARACTALLLRDSELLSAYVAATGPSGPVRTGCSECDPGYSVDPVANDLVSSMFPNCPQLRLDRMLMQKHTPLRPRSASLIGTSMLFNGRHWPIWPSDHFGVLFELDLIPADKVKS